jgi:hypothetical protein
MTNIPDTPQPANGQPKPWYESDDPVYAWTSNWYWAPNDDEIALLEALATEALIDAADGPSPAEARWAQMIIEGSLPPICGDAPEPSPEDLADFDAWLEQYDRENPLPDLPEVHTIEEWDAIRRAGDGKVTDQDLMAAGPPVG